MHNPQTLNERHAFTLYCLAMGKTYEQIGNELAGRFEVRSGSAFNAGQNAAKAIFLKFGVGSGSEAVSAGYRYGFLFWLRNKLHYSPMALLLESAGWTGDPVPDTSGQLELPLVFGEDSWRQRRLAQWRTTAIT